MDSNLKGALIARVRKQSAVLLERAAKTALSVAARLDQRALNHEQRTFWNENGYLVLPRFFAAENIKRAEALFDEAWASRHTADNPLVIDALAGPLMGKRMLFRDAPDELRKGPYKLNDVYLESDIVRELILAPRLVDVLGELLGAAPIVCNSLTFEYGSQQGFHVDTFYMPPQTTNGLVVSSIALEDVDQNAGPLQFYPGSHQIPPYVFSHGGITAVEAEMDACNAYFTSEVAKRGLRAERFQGRAGDVFLWHAQLYHGGSNIRDKRKTRKSIVTHYWRIDDVPPAQRGYVGPGRYYVRRPHAATD